MSERAGIPGKLEEGLLKLKRWRDIPIAILAWTAVVAVAFWCAGHIIRALVLLALGALFAYALTPIVTLFQRFMPRTLSIFIVYIVFLSALGILVYFIVDTTVHQIIVMTRQALILLHPGPGGQPPGVQVFLNRFGITTEQLSGLQSQLTMRAEQIASNSLPLLRRVVDFVIDIIVVMILSIYLSLDGARAARWIRNNAPVMARIDSVLNMLERVVGGYIRGQIALAVLIALLVWIGVQFIFHLPYAVFLGVLAFVMAFIPVFGTFISGALCVLIGLTQGWPVALGVLIYFVAIHVIESEVVGPRLVGQAVGLHPIVSLFALVAGTELFGIWGTLFASPIAGIIQATTITLWRSWRTLHPEQFQGHANEGAVPEADETKPDE